MYFLDWVFKRTWVLIKIIIKNNTCRSLKEFQTLPSWHLLAQSKRQKHQNKTSKFFIKIAKYLPILITKILLSLFVQNNKLIKIIIKNNTCRSLKEFQTLPSWHLLAQSKRQKHQNKTSKFFIKIAKYLPILITKILLSLFVQIDNQF